MKLLEGTKKKLVEKLEESKIFSQTYILYDVSSVLKETFVTEFEKYANIFSQFMIFCQKNDRNFKNFTADNKEKNLQLKNNYNGEKDLYYP